MIHACFNATFTMVMDGGWGCSWLNWVGGGEHVITGVCGVVGHHGRTIVGLFGQQLLFKSYSLLVTLLLLLFFLLLHFLYNFMIHINGVDRRIVQRRRRRRR